MLCSTHTPCLSMALFSQETHQKRAKNLKRINSHKHERFLRIPSWPTEPCAPLTAAQGEPRTVGGRGVPCSVRSMRSSFLSAARIVKGETNQGGKGQDVGRGATLPVTSITGHARTPAITSRTCVLQRKSRSVSRARRAMSGQGRVCSSKA